MDEKRASFKPIYPRFVERVSVKNLYQGNTYSLYDGNKQEGMIIDGVTRLLSQCMLELDEQHLWSVTMK